MVEKDQHLVGIVTVVICVLKQNLDQPVANIMTPKDRLVTVKEATDREIVRKLLHKHRIEKVLVINDSFQLRGMITVKDILKEQEKPLASKDRMGQLLVGAAVGTGAESDERVAALIAAGVDVLIVDTAHGHSKGVIERVRWIKKHYPDVAVIAGNIATGKAAKALADAGVDAVKVGIGPGSICTNVLHRCWCAANCAIANVSEALRRSHVGIIADGGIRYSGDICKAIAAGASAVMVGSLFAGTEEAPGEVELYHGRSYKAYRGMGSLGAMAQRNGSSDRYFQEGMTSTDKLVPEGIEGRVPYKGNLVTIINQLIGGLRSGMGYTGCAGIEELRNKAEFVRVTSSGVRESHVHDVIITKEAPNYQVVIHTINSYK